MVSYLTEELVRQGHEVTLFASGDSQTSARLVRGLPAGALAGAGLPGDACRTTSGSSRRSHARPTGST